MFYKCPQLTVGPATEEGFFYDFWLPDNQVVSQNHYSDLESIIKTIIKDKHRFERLELSKEQALDMFSENAFKTRIILDKVAEQTSVYKVGEFIDLCTGPHLPHTGLVKAFKLMKNSAIKQEAADSLQRIYGISFPEKAQMTEYLTMREEALKRDHRIIGKQQKLFFWNSAYAPGSTFFLPHGTMIYNKLTDLMKNEYTKRGFKEVKTPNLFNIDLWKVSGHYKNYKDDLYLIPPSA